jgi:hypothetical protein
MKLYSFALMALFLILGLVGTTFAQEDKRT